MIISFVITEFCAIQLRLRKSANFPLALLSVCLAATSAPARGAKLGAGDHDVKLQHGGRERSAIVHVPPRAAEKSALPLVLNFHGGGGHGANQKDYSLLDSLADQEKFAAVYPNGNGRFENRLLTWNGGTCCAYAAVNNIDDVGFVRALLAAISDRLPVDRRRVYATGLSNGAMMSYRLAAQASDVITAVAPVAGGMVLPTITSSRAVPILHIHSVDDPRALYSGGLGPPFPLTQSRVLHPNIDRMIAQWVKHNGCAVEPSIVERCTDRDSRGHSATKYVYSSCRDGVEVVLWKLAGAGHVWPGGKQKVMERLLGPSTDIIDANREMWNFFSRFSL